MENTTCIVTARVEPNLKKAFDAICKENDVTASQMIRGFIRQTVKEYAENTRQPTLPTIPATPKGKRK